MRLYVDFLGADHGYRARGEAFVDPAIPLDVLRSAALSAASCGVTSPTASRLFHVEHRRYVHEATLAAAGIGEYDSVVVVAPVAGRYPRADEVLLRWCAAGGATRRRAQLSPPCLAPAASAHLLM